jgi:hypothetical protein
MSNKSNKSSQPQGIEDIVSLMIGVEQSGDVARLNFKDSQNNKKTVHYRNEYTMARKK